MLSLEQTSVSVVLQQRGRVVPCDDLLVHYWGFERPFVHTQIANALQTSDFSTDRLGLPPVGLLDHLRSRLLARTLRWDADSRYTLEAALAARSSRVSADGYAGAWTETPLLVLERARQLTGLVPRNGIGLAQHRSRNRSHFAFVKATRSPRSRLGSMGARCPRLSMHNALDARSWNCVIPRKLT
ncbi:MAG: hypothetical protein RL385_4548 [Pseudomonadota bacterium]|jgi:hypothetical protein